MDPPTRRPATGRPPHWLRPGRRAYLLAAAFGATTSFLTWASGGPVWLAIAGVVLTGINLALAALSDGGDSRER